MQIVLAGLLQIVLAGAAFAEEFTGLVVGVSDGDVIRVMRNERAEEIRLNGIDCPEKGQDYSPRAKEATSELVSGREVTLSTFDKDMYGRFIADVFLPDGTSVNQTLVREGWCWWYRKHAPQDARLERLEREAREAKRGLWQDPVPVPPPGRTGGRWAADDRLTGAEASFPCSFSGRIVPQPLAARFHPTKFQAGVSVGESEGRG